MTATLRGVTLLVGTGRPEIRKILDKSDRGAALVELAVALPLLMMLIIGMVSAGVAFNHQLALTHSARESSRYAATLPVTNFGTMNAWLDEIADSGVENATGSLDAGTPGLVVCVAYVHPDGSDVLDMTSRRVDSGGSVAYLQGVNATCFADGRPDNERRVQVSVERDIGFNALFFSTTIDLDSMAVSRFEAAGGF